MGRNTYLFFDGASRKNPGPAAGSCVLKASDGIDTLVQDSEILGKKTNNEAETCGLFLDLYRARASEITALSIRGDSQLIIEHIAWRVLHQPMLIPTPGQGPSPNGLAVLPSWDRCIVGTAQL